MKTRILIIAIFAFSSLIAQNAKDSLIIRSINVENNVKSGDVTGSLVTINSKLFYDTAYHHVSKPQKVIYSILLFDKNKNPIRAVESTQFKSKTNQLKKNKSGLIDFRRSRM